MLTKSLFFDTDCLSSFFWINKEGILISLFAGKIIIPMQVYYEISSPNVPHLKQKTDLLIKNGQALKLPIQIGTTEEKLYKKLTANPYSGFAQIGKGEASCIALAYCHQGIVASNNIVDINQYITHYNLPQITTGGILLLAFNKIIITENEGNVIWTAMLAKRRRIGANSFTEYKNNPKNLALNNIIKYL